MDSISDEKKILVIAEDREDETSFTGLINNGSKELRFSYVFSHNYQEASSLLKREKFAGIILFDSLTASENLLFIDEITERSRPLPMIILGSPLTTHEHWSNEISSFIRLLPAKDASLINLEKDLTYLAERIDFETTILDVQSKLYKSNELNNLGQLATGIIHELNNPLTILKSLNFNMTKAVQKDLYSKEKLLQKLGGVSKAINTCIDVISSFKKVFLDAGNESFKTVSLTSLLGNSEKYILPHAMAQRVSLKINYPKEDIQVECQELTLIKLMVNLATNSFHELTSSSTPSLEINTFYENGYLSISVTGHRQEANLENEHQLDLCHRIALQHRGTLTSKHNQFTFTFPIKQPPKDEKISVLVVDDEPGILQLIADEFSEKNFEVRAADGAKKALEILESYSPDIVISDIFMPKMNGYELREKINNLKNPPPVLLMSGYSVAENEDNSYPVIRKPFDLDTLMKTTMEQVLTKKSPSQNSTVH